MAAIGAWRTIANPTSRLATIRSRGYDRNTARLGEGQFIAMPFDLTEDGLVAGIAQAFVTFVLLVIELSRKPLAPPAS